MSGNLGVMCAPVFCSIAFPIGGFLLVFGSCGLGSLIFSSVTIFFLRPAREEWLAAVRELNLIKEQEAE